MASGIRWIFLFFAALVLTALLEPPLMSLFASLGWHDLADGIPVAIVNWLSSLVGANAFPWVAAGVLGLSAGTWVHWLAVRFDSKTPSKPERFQDLSLSIWATGKEWMDGLKGDDGEIDLKKRSRKSDLKLRALYAELRKLGLTPPVYDEADAPAYNIGHYSYLQTLEPFAKRGLLAEAKKESRDAVREWKDATQRVRSQQETQ